MRESLGICRATLITLIYPFFSHNLSSKEALIIHKLLKLINLYY